MREHSLWESHIASEITKSFNDEMPTRLEDFLQALTLEKISDFLTRLYDDSNKYLFPANIINTFYEQFLDFLVIADEDRIVESFLENLEGAEYERKLQELLITDLLTLEQQALRELFPNQSPLVVSQSAPPSIFSHTASSTALNTSQSPSWRKLTELQIKFEEFFESLDITFALEPESDHLILRYYQRAVNAPLLNYESVGTGITERLYFLYQLIAKTDHCFLIVHPEHALHPHSQRMLYNLIREYSEFHQMVVITHSLFMFQPDDLFNLRIFTLDSGISHVNKLDVSPISSEYFQLKRNFTVRNRDAIFADGIVFVEGPSEETTFPYFFRAYGLDLDRRNLSLINIGGKGSFSAFKKFADQLQKRYWFVFDNDFLGLRAHQNITSETFKASVVYKQRHLFSTQIIDMCDELAAYNPDEETIEFEENLELLRIYLQDFHIFVFQSDFEDIFESQLASRVQFHGGKVEKAMQLEDFLRDHEEEQWLPDELYRFIEIIQDDLRHH